MRWPWRRPRDEEGPVPFRQAAAAVGRQGPVTHYTDLVDTVQVVGSMTRAADFTRDFEPRCRDRRFAELRKRIATQGQREPIRAVRLGQMYFVVDGHHRLAVARALGHDSVPARVVHICTVAYACTGLRLPDLASKDAERRFLEAFPLPGDTRPHLWLDDPGDWELLRRDAVAWTRRHTDAPDTVEAARQWWECAVLPAVRPGLRPGGPRPVQAYAAALRRQ